MKKLMVKTLVAAACVVGCGIASAQETCWTNNNNGQVYTYYTNTLELAQKSADTGILYIRTGFIRPEEFAAVDDILFASPSNINVGVGVSWRNGAWYKLPKSAKKWYENGWSKISPNHAKIEYTYYYGTPEEKDVVNRNHDLVINSIDTAFYSFPADGWITNWKKSVINTAMKTTKRQLRKEGISFIVKDGVNPVQERLDALTLALDAPRMAGLKEAAAACGLNYTQDTDKLLPTAAEITQLKDDVYNGEVEFDCIRKGKLLLCLGVADYNAFVKEYNGDNN